MSKKKQTVLGMVVVALMLFVPVLSIAGSLEPSAAPGPTMKTMDQIPPTWSQALQCDTTACPRFQEVFSGNAVLDKETGLVWDRTPNSTRVNWKTAMWECHNMRIGNRFGWRLPTVDELASLVDVTSPFEPMRIALPIGHPFWNIQYGIYWSATTVAGSTTNAYAASFYQGYVIDNNKTYDQYNVWCVRGGQGYDGQ